MLVFAAAGVAAAILAFVAVWRSMGSAAQLQSIAVMPFDEVGLDQAHQYSGDGIADELTTQLGRESGLKVAARTSAFALKDRKMDAREIGRTLGVDALLEGSVLQVKDRVRVAVRIVNTRDGYQIWSNAWDQPLDDMPADPGADPHRGSPGPRRRAVAPRFRGCAAPPSWHRRRITCICRDDISGTSERATA